jgi:hypothetical protein
MHEQRVSATHEHITSRAGTNAHLVPKFLEPNCLPRACPLHRVLGHAWMAPPGARKFVPDPVDVFSFQN